MIDAVSSPRFSDTTVPRLDQLKILINRRQRGLAVIGLGAALIGVGVLGSLLFSVRDRRGVEIIRGGEEQAQISPAAAGVVVDVAGAVEHPGVFQLENNARLSDALAAAGGLAGDADRVWVSRSLNLAQRLTDGAKIFIPSRGESAATVLGDSNAPVIESGEVSNKVSINSSSLSELDMLWGIGEARARAIIDGRPYGSIEELVTKKILPENVVEKNRERLVL